MRRLLPLLLLTFLCPTPALAEPAELDPGPVVERLIARFGADSESLQSFRDLRASSARLDRLDAFDAAWRKSLSDLDWSSLDADARIDHVLLRNLLDRRAHDRGVARTQLDEATPLLPFAAALLELERARRAMEPVVAKDAAAALDAAKSAVDRVKRQLEHGLDPKKATTGNALETTPVIAHRTAGTIDQIRRMLKDWYEYRAGYEPEFSWWTEKPHAALAKALEGYAKFLREKVAKQKNGGGDLIGDPIGRASLEAALAFEFIPYSPGELIALAEREFEWCEARGLEAAKELGVDGGWAAVVEHVKGLHAAPGTQDDLVARQGREAIQFLDERELVTIPPLCRETWRLKMISPKQQKTLPFAVYWGQAMGVAYASADMAHSAKLQSMRGNNEHFTRIVTPHELIPGHHLQIFMADRHRTHRKAFRTPFLVEGWALHWEMLLWDREYARGAADRVGMLFWRMHRCARILVTLRFHLGEMKPDEMIKFLADRVGLERDGATSEVRRYIGGSYGPLYQCAYMLGGLQLRALHRDLVGGGKLTDRQFHDAVLRQGAIPVELIRARLTDQEIAPDHSANWRFAD